MRELNDMQEIMDSLVHVPAQMNRIENALKNLGADGNSKRSSQVEKVSVDRVVYVEKESSAVKEKSWIEKLL